MISRYILAIQSSKETRQGRYVKTLLELGLDYTGSLSNAKTTLNRFLRHDAKLLGIREIGNGNNRNLLDRIMPILAAECEKQKLKSYGTYPELRNALKDTLFANAISYSMSNIISLILTPNNISL